MTPITAEDQVAVGSTATVSATFVDQNGEPAAPAGTVTVSAVGPAGAAILPAGTATTGSGPSRFVELPAGATDAPTVIALEWTNGTSTIKTLVEVVSSFYATVAAIRSSDAALADVDKFTDADVRAARRLVEVEFERITGRAFVPRFQRELVDVSGSSIVARHYNVEPGTVALETFAGDGTATPWTGSALVSNPAAGIIRLGSSLCSTCAVSYVHGHHRPPSDVEGAFMLRVLDILSRPFKGQDSRTETFTSADNGGTFTLIVPGMKGSQTGIPDVDVVLAGYTVGGAKLK